MAITGVVAGHAGIDIIETFVNYWHLPVFFFVSGYFLKPKHLADSKKYIFSRFSRLLIPFIIFAISAVLLHNILINWHVIDGHFFQLSDYLLSLRQLLFLSCNEQLIGAMWFLPALFIVSLFGMLCAKFLQVRATNIYFVVGVIVLATTFSYMSIPSPYCIWQYISITWIFLLGYFCAQTDLDLRVCRWWIFVISISLLSIALFLNIHVGLQASMIKTQSFLSPLVFIAGILFINYLAVLIKNTRIGLMFAIIGDFSFSIMALHFIGFKILTFIRTLFDDRVNLQNFPVDSTDIGIWMPVYIMIGISFSIFVSILYSKIKNAWNNSRCLQESGENC